MSNRARKLLAKAIESPASLRFRDLVFLAEAFGFEYCRGKGSHRIFKCEGVSELLNVQDVNGMAKAYQVNQLLGLVERYNLKLREGP